MRRVTLLLFGLITICGTFAQSDVEIPFTETDTILSKPIVFTTSSASEYIIDLLGMDNLWKPSGDTVKLSLTRLIDHFNEPFDSVESRLFRFNYDSTGLAHINIVRNDTLPLRWLNERTIIIDTVALEKYPLIIQKTVIKKAVDVTAFVSEDTIYDVDRRTNYIFQDQDTITERFIDTLYLRSMKIQMHQITEKGIIPPIISDSINKSYRFLPDSSKIIISDTIVAIVADRNSPFHIVPNEKMPDSLRVAIKTLLSYTNSRDSILLFINDIQGQKVPFWLTEGKDDLYRYWVKNFKNDSITIWMGNPSKYDITLTLEEDINVNRLEKVVVDDIPITMARPERSLAKVEPLKEIPVYWDYKFSSSFALNHTYLSNWSKGGENTFSSVLDIMGTAKYANTEDKTVWLNSGRLRYGNIITEQFGLRTNTDIFEINSQYNKVIKDKIDFSAVFYMKNQVAKGYKYPNDSVVVSKFLNPGTFTIGVGVEYKPFKKTSFNFSPLSYKNTFVLDTANINQTTHGIAADKRARQEMGGQLMIKNSMTILEDLNITNSVRLFSSYLNKPENIDVDWEINLEKRINWYSTVRLNIHMIYDDDIRFPVLDDNDQPITLPDGSIKKAPKLQYKQFLGLGLTFLFNL